jgi:Ulp1 family protease
VLYVLTFLLFFVRYDCGLFGLKNADCLGQDLDPAEKHYAQKDMPNVRRMVVLELIRQEIRSDL